MQRLELHPHKYQLLEKNKKQKTCVFAIRSKVIETMISEIEKNS
jgi:hypothetical protein